MSLFRRNRDYALDAPAPFPVRRIPARELHRGMTLVAMPEGWTGVSSSDGHWPVIVDDPEFMERGEGGRPCVYWTTDEPGDVWPDRSPDYWTGADLLVTVAARNPEENR